jgi:hypothetical protein
VHFDHCGAIGHNLMLSGKGSSALWLIIGGNDMENAEALWCSLGQDIHKENHFSSVDELESATFSIYVVHQKPGDLVVIPSLSYHQVVNLVRT